MVLFSHEIVSVNIYIYIQHKIYVPLMSLQVNTQLNCDLIGLQPPG
jgi:hypothetical protein